MKKILLLLLMLISFISLSACEGDDPPLPNQNDDKERVHLVVLAGQSGARGKALVNDLSDDEKEPNENVDIIADGLIMDALNNIPETISDEVMIDVLEPGYGDFGSEFGPEIGMGQTLASCYPKESYFDYESVVVKYTGSGSTILDHWYSKSAVADAELKDVLNLEQARETDNGTYGPLTYNLFQLIDYTIEYLEEEGYEVVIDGAAFVHGEQDAKFTENMNIYEKALEYFIQDFRDYYDDSDMPFVITEALTNSATYSNKLRDIQKNVATKMNNVSFIRTNDLYTNTFEPWHFGAESNNVLGNRIAAEIVSYNDPRSIESIDEGTITVPYGVSVELPQYVKATFTNEFSGYVKVEEYTSSYNPNTLGEQDVKFTVNSKDGIVEKSIKVNVMNNSAFIDGVLNEYNNVKANPLPNNLGNVYVIKGVDGLFIAADINDNHLWTDGEDWHDGDMGQKDNNDDFRVYLTTSDVNNRYSLCLSSANLLRVYDKGISLSESAYRLSQNNLVYKNKISDYKFHVTTKGVTNNADVESNGILLELYISYASLGITNPDDIKLCFNYNNVSGTLTNNNINKVNADNYLVAGTSVEKAEELIESYIAIKDLIQ